MKRGEVFVRARNLLGERGMADVLDLDEDSFRLWVAARLMALSHADYFDDGVYYVRHDARLRRAAES